MRYAPQKCTHPSQAMQIHRLRRSQRVLVVTAVAVAAPKVGVEIVAGKAAEREALVVRVERGQRRWHWRHWRRGSRRDGVDNRKDIARQCSITGNHPRI
jgi:hypothetical protein